MATGAVQQAYFVLWVCFILCGSVPFFVGRNKKICIVPMHSCVLGLPFDHKP